MMSIFIKYPPSGDAGWRRPKFAEWEPCTIGLEAEYFNAVRLIRYCEFSFNETGNPLYALEAFRLATEVKLYPPLWAIEFMDKRFSHAMTNKITLDRAFGFSTKGLGKGKSTKPKTRDKLRVRNRLLCLSVFKLEGAGLSRPAACKALSSFLARLPNGASISPLDPWRGALYQLDMTGKGIEKAVVESEESLIELREEIAQAAKSWTDSEKTQMLSIFYPSELPAR